MRRRNSVSIAALCTAAVIAGVSSSSAYGIYWCFDWVAYKVSKEDANQLNAQKLRDLLKKHGYDKVLTVRAKTSAARPDPEDIKLEIKRVAPPAQELDERLQPGDVLIFGDDHTGIVRTRSGRVDHYLQVPGKPGTRYTPQEVAKQENYFVGRKSWTLRELFAFARDQPPAHSHEYDWRTWKEWLGRLVYGAPKQYPLLRRTVEVWRRSKEAPGPTGGRTATKLRLTLKGSGGEAWAERDLKTLAVKAFPADITVTARNGSAVAGSATLAGGSLGAGEILYVYATRKTETSAEILALCQGKGNCSFTMPTNPPGRAAREVAVAYICKGVPTPGNDTCYHQFDLRVDVLWTE